MPQTGLEPVTARADEASRLCRYRSWKNAYRPCCKDCDETEIEISVAGSGARGGNTTRPVSIGALSSARHPATAHKFGRSVVTWLI